MGSNPLFGVSLKHRDVCVFDIGSSSVGVAFARYNGKKKPIDVLFAKREQMHFGPESDAEHLAIALSDAIQRAARYALDMIGSIDAISSTDYTVSAFVHSPWSHSESVRVERTLQRQSIMDKKLLQEFVDRNLGSSIPEGYEEYDSHITSVELNGYETENPYDKPAETIAVTKLSSTMETHVHSTILDALWQVFQAHSPTIVPFTRAALESDLCGSHEESYTLFDISGAYTAVISIDGATITNTGSVPFGFGNLIAALQKDADDYQKARSELAMYLQNTCTPSQCRSIETALEPLEREWVQVFGDSCTAMMSGEKLPAHACVIAPSEYSPWFTRNLERLDFGQFTITGKAMHTDMPDLTKRLVRKREKVVLDTALALSVRFVEN